MDIKELRSLATLARTGNITRTGQILHLTPSAIHRHLQLLGEELDLPLYEKRGKTLRLTGAALSLMPLVEDLLLQFESVKTAAHDWKHLGRGAVRVGSGPSFGSSVLPGFLMRFRSRHPGLDVFLEAGQTTQLLGELEEGTVDVVFLVARPEVEQTFVVEAKWEFTLPLVTSPRLGPTGKVRLRDLADYPFLLYRQGSFFEEQIDHYFMRNNFSPKVAMRMENAEPMKALVRSGFGISLLPDWSLGHEIDTGELNLVRLREPPLKSRISMIRRRTAHVPAPLAALIDAAKSWRW
jgi:DNA-binding transcriptional LysR family regulator